MLLRRRAPGIDHRPANTTQEFAHLDEGWIAVLRWLNVNRVDYVLLGVVAHAIRGHRAEDGPVAIVPAPYRRNYERLVRALEAARARQRNPSAQAGTEDTVPIKLTAEKLARGQRWRVRCGNHDLDIEAVSSRTQPLPGAPTVPGPGYQELLYEASRFHLADGIAVEVASPEDIEHYAYLSRTGQPPEMRISRAVAADAG